MAIVNTNKLEVTKLDFHGIRDSLKTFLQGQTEFNDYDFDGSGLGAILDLLSYNTHYLAFYLNMVANEMYLDTASQRSSVVGIARSLGYTPKSARGALASVNFTLTTSSGAATITLPKWTPFSVVVDKDKFLFYTLADKVVVTTASTSSFSNIPIKEGVLVSQSWTYNTEGKNQRFLLDNPYIDVTTLSVTVKASKATGTTNTYILYKNLEGLDSTSEVYFLQEVEDGRYEIYFGDGIYGKQLSAENVITVEYLTTNGSRANYAGRNQNENFSLLTSINDSNGQSTTASSVTISTNGYATSGTLPESVSSIKFNAPLSFAAQDRAVTANDYKNLLLSNYGNIRGIKVWGGKPKLGIKYSRLQERSGTIYICILPKHGNFLPAVTKNYILQSILEPYKIIGMRNEIIDPEFVKLLTSVEVIFNPTVSDIPVTGLEKKILKSVRKYAMTDLEVFDGKYRHSVLQSVINDADPSIVSVNNLVTRFRVESRFDFSNVQITEPAYTGAFIFKGFKKVVFNPINFGMSVQPSSVGNGIKTNNFYVWVESLPNYNSQPPTGGAEYIKQNLWMKGTELFAWSVKKVDAVGDPTSNTDITNEVHAGKFIECYFKDDGEGRLNLYATGENGDIRVPFSSQEGEYKDSPDLSWIETQGSKFGWEFLQEKMTDPARRLVYMTDSATGDLKATADPALLDYESWGSVNYHLGRVGKMKPIAILGMSSDITKFADGVAPLSIAQSPMYSGQTTYTSIKLTQSKQSLNWDAFQYMDEDGRNLGGFSASGNLVMVFDTSYLTTNIKLRTTSDRPSLQIGTRSATEEVQKALPSTTKGKETTSKKIVKSLTQAIVEAAKPSVGPAWDSGELVGPADGTTTSGDLIVTDDNEKDEYITSSIGAVIEIDETIDLLKTSSSCTPSNYGAPATDPLGSLYQINSQSRDLTNYLVQLVTLEGAEGAKRHATNNASTGTWEVRLVKLAEVVYPPIIASSTSTTTIKTKPKVDLTTVVSVGPAWDSGELVGPASGTYESDSSGIGNTSSAIAEVVAESDSNVVPDGHNISPISEFSPLPTEVVTKIQIIEPTDSEKADYYLNGNLWNPKTNQYESPETKQLPNGAVYDTTLSITTTDDQDESDYATSSLANDLGWSELSCSCEAYSAAPASTFDNLDVDIYTNSAGVTITKEAFGAAFVSQDLNFDWTGDGVVNVFDLVSWAAGKEKVMNSSSCDSQESYTCSVC